VGPLTLRRFNRKVHYKELIANIAWLEILVVLIMLTQSRCSQIVTMVMCIVVRWRCTETHVVQIILMLMLDTLAKRQRLRRMIIEKATTINTTSLLLFILFLGIVSHRIQKFFNLADRGSLFWPQCHCLVVAVALLAEHHIWATN
jgi:hypothetical protein